MHELFSAQEKNDCGNEHQYARVPNASSGLPLSSNSGMRIVENAEPKLIEK